MGVTVVDETDNGNKPQPRRCDMPGRNGTGPRGAGPMTGRGMGVCAGHAAPGYANPMPGRGMGRGCRLRQGYGGQVGRGRGTGWGRRAAPFCGNAPDAAPTREQEISTLKGEAEHLAGTLEEIKKRIAEMESTT
jgi:hypothetical protein